MVIDRVDARDRRIGTVRRDRVFDAQANFRVVHVFLFNRERELLLQRISSVHGRHPGRWGSSAAGYLFAGESYEDAAARKVRDELGVATSLERIGKTSMTDEGCIKFICLFRGIHDGPFELDPAQAESVSFVPVERLRREIAARERSVTPTFHHVLDHYLHSTA